VEASDNNPDGFLIEGLEVVENKDLKTQNRSLASRLNYQIFN